MKRSGLLRGTGWFVLGALFLAGCGDSAGTGFGPEEDAAVDNDTGAEDSGGGLVFDVPRDNGNNIDAGGPPADLGNNRPDSGVPVTDRGTVNPVDNGGSTGVCPSSCQSNADCNPCRDPSDPAGSEYCCMSGLCLFMSGVCASVPDGGGMSGGTDGGADGGIPGGNDAGGDGGFDFNDIPALDAAGGLDAGP